MDVPEELRAAKSRLMRAIRDYVRAEIASEKRGDPDGMGAYYEEQELDKELDDFCEEVLRATSK